MKTKERRKNERKSKPADAVDTLKTALANGDGDVHVFGPFPFPGDVSDLNEALALGGLVPQPKRRKVRLSRIRVLLSQPLTWAEAEDIKHRGVNFRLSVSPNRQHLWAEGAMDSRQMFRIVAKVLAERYVNYFPRAVRTFSEYSGPWSQ